MSKIDENRREFFKIFGKYLLGFATFGVASFFGLKRDGELHLGKMKNIKLGMSEAYGACGSSYECAGGGGQCGSAYECAGGGRNSSGRGQCGSAYECAGGGGQCGSAYECAGQ